MTLLLLLRNHRKGSTPAVVVVRSTALPSLTSIAKFKKVS